MNTLVEQGYFIIEKVFDTALLNEIAVLIEKTGNKTTGFRRSRDLYAIRHFLQEIPGIRDLIFTPVLRGLARQYMAENYFVSKSIYFDKPESSNWFVAYHQDLTISVTAKAALSGYGPWSRKEGYFAVQPPLSLLEKNLTIRIHLDDTDKQNGALKVVPGSHLKGLYRPETIDWDKEREQICNVPAGGIMLMRPLLLHASDRSTLAKRRRVMHIEFSNATLPEELSWAEKSAF